MAGTSSASSLLVMILHSSMYLSRPTASGLSSVLRPCRDSGTNLRVQALWHKWHVQGPWHKWQVPVPVAEVRRELHVQAHWLKWDGSAMCVSHRQGA
jgi:hypothetical protein